MMLGWCECSVAYCTEGRPNAWRAADLGAMLTQYVAIHKRGGAVNGVYYNEVIVNALAWNTQLPAIIEAFFVVKVRARAREPGTPQRARAANGFALRRRPPPTHTHIALSAAGRRQPVDTERARRLPQALRAERARRAAARAEAERLGRAIRAGVGL